MSNDFIPAAKPIVGEDELGAVTRVLRSGSIAQGSEVAAFETEFSHELLDGHAAVAVNSGTTGLHLGLIACGIRPGDEVIVPSFTFAATANAVVLAGAVPVFADIDPVTFCLDPDSVRAVVTPRTRAIMPVHLYGHPADMTSICSLAAENDLLVFEDAAQAHGARWNGRRVGTFGAFGMFSLYPTKNMTAGEGGMVSVRDVSAARTLRLLRNQGMEERYRNEIVGFNARMTDLHAAIGRVQLTKLAGWTSDRQRNAEILREGITALPTPVAAPGVEHVYHQFTVRVADDRNGFQAALESEFGVGSGAYYPTPVHRLPSFHLDLDLPETEKAAREVLSLPVHPSLTARDLDRIVDAVQRLSRAGS